MVRPAVLALLATPTLLAQSQPTFYAAYQDGLEAEHQGHWRAALAAFDRAVALRPEPAARVITYGNNLLLNYAPYSHQARCHLELGELEAARAALSRAAVHAEPRGERERLAHLIEAHAPARAAEAPKPEPPHVPSAPPAEPQAPTQAPIPPPPAPEPKPAAQAEPRPSRPAETRPLPAPVAARETEPTAPAVVAPAAPPAPVGTKPAAEAPAGGRTWTWLAALGLGVGALFAWRHRKPKESGLGDPERLGPYRVERLLGRGGFASTYLARHESTKVPVALKRLHPYRQDDPEFRDRFRQEARLGMMLDHPNLVRVLEAGPEDDVPWLAMAFVSGARLDQRLKGKGPMPLPEVIRIARGIAGAMAHAHGLGIVHRDLKPGNVMFEGDEVKVVDFGIARTVDSHTLTTTYAFLGTPLYAAPEAQLKTQVGPAADRYAFGIMLFEMLTGAPPFTGETPFEILDQHRSKPVPDLAALRPDAPAALVDLVGRLCEKDPARRPEDEEVLRVLEGL